jgi:ATP-dependent exoDNAse (exonuclease V) beta subunit
VSVDKRPSDHDVRVAAVDPARSFLVQAPAGSGKTELLTDRILALLATVDRPEEIVAITFTRKAASEMHERVLLKLRAAAEALEAEDGGDAQGDTPVEEHRQRSLGLAREALARDQANGWNLLRYPARLSIRTIDSLCAHLVRAMPWLSHLGGLPRVADNPQAHYDAAAQATLAMVDDEPMVAALLDHLDVDGRAAQELLALGLARRDQWMPLLDAGDDEHQLLANLEAAVGEDLERLAGMMPMGWAGDIAPSVAAAARHLAEQGGKLDLAALEGWDGAPFGTDPDVDGPRWRALADILLTAKGELRAKVNKNQGFGPGSPHKQAFEAWLAGARPHAGAWAAALDAVRHAPFAGYTAEQVATLNAMLGVLRLASAQLQLRFADTGEVDFIEIAQRAVQALGSADDPSDLLLKLDASVKHILVDEFQDTSHSQIVLLESLTAGWSPGDGRTLFLVGDPMQSIYRFRKAEVGLFLKVRDQGLAHVKPEFLRLTDNFRSDGGVVDWVNQTFRPLFPSADDAALGAISYTGSRAFHEAGEGEAVRFHPVWQFEEEGEADADSSVRRTEGLVLDLVRNALANREAGSKHPVAILVRARNHLEGVLRILRQEGISCRAVELEALKSRQVIDDLVQLARALSHDGDRLAWLSVLRSPVCGATLASLHALFGADHVASVPFLLARWLRAGGGQESPDLPPDERQRLRRAAAILLDTGNRSGAVPFSAWLEQCWQRLGGPEVYAGPDDLADAERFFRLVETLAPYGGLDAAELDARLDGLYASSGGDGPSVEVMTIHKSKGMEFDEVVLMGLHRRPASDRSPLVRFELDGDRILLGPIKPRAQDESDPVSDYLARREKQRADYESDRLLYVAATRARRRLHLVGLVRLEGGAPRAPAAGSLLGRLWDHLVCPEPDTASPEARLPAPGERRELLRLALRGLPEPAAAVAERPGKPWDWRDDAGDEAAVGTVAHAWLEYLGSQGAGTDWTPDRLEQSVPAFRVQLSRAGVREDSLDAAAEAVRATLASTLASERGRWLLSVARGHREWSLVDAAGRVSVIDLAISSEEGWLVVDYKTGLPAADEPIAHFTARMRERYTGQMERYRLAVSALDGRPVRAALYFPRADLWVDC